MDRLATSPSDSSRGSVSHWLDELRKGGSVAVQELWIATLPAWQRSRRIAYPTSFAKRMAAHRT